MAETITLPGMGAVKREYVYIGAAGVAGFLAFAYYRRRQAAQAAPTWADVDQSELVPDGDYSSPGGNSNIPPQDLTGDTIKTNAQWSQKATEILVNLGFDPGTVATALGVFFQREGLSAAQMDAVKAAHGQLGPPPEGGPWPIRSAPPTGDTTELPAPQNLRVTGATRNSIALAWDAVPGATSYQIEWEGETGKFHTRFDRTSGTTYTVSDMPLPDEDYQLNVRAIKGTRQGTTASITARTTR